MFLAETYGRGATWNNVHLDYALDGPSFVGYEPGRHGPNTLHFSFVDGHIKPLTVRTTASGSRDWNDLFGYYTSIKRADGTFKYIGPRSNPKRDE